jgi:hypothetical protein
VASGAVVALASRDLDLLGYGIFSFTLSDEEVRDIAHRAA